MYYWLLLSHLVFAFGPSAVVCRLHPVEENIPKGAPIAVTLSCEAGQAASLDLGPDGVGNLRFAIVASSGRSKTFALNTPQLYTSGLLHLSGGEVYEERINLSSAFAHEPIDSYNLSASIAAPGSKEQAIITNQVRIKISDEDRFLLGERCADLARSILQPSSTAAERLELAAELSSVHDQAAIESMAAVLGKGLAVDDQMIDGLRSIGTREALQVLHAYASKPNKDDDMRLYAVRSISDIRKNSSDESVRKLADRILAQLHTGMR